MIRCCHVITGLNTGGAEVTLYRLLQSLPPPRLHHAVVVLGGAGGLSERVAQVAEVHYLNMRPGHMSVVDILDLRRLIRKFHADVVQGWMYHGNLMATLAAFTSQIPVVWGVHHALEDLKRERRSTRYAIRVSRWLSRLPRSIVYCSDAGARQHLAYGFRARSTEVIPNGYDTQVYRPDVEARRRLRHELDIAEDALAIGLVARVHPVKDHANFLRAAAIYAAKYEDAVFVLVGDGTEQGASTLSGMIEELGLAGRVRLCGRRSDIAGVFNALDIASCSSWSEAFPNTIAEAMACGTPCAATKVGDVGEIIGDTGIVVPVRDSVALADAWLKLAMLGTEGRRVLGMEARRRIVERYSLGIMAQRYANLYGGLAKPV